MCVDHGRVQIVVAENFLNRADIVPILQEVGCERMSKCVEGGIFVDVAQFKCLFERPRKCGSCDVMSGHVA